ncbi:MAG: putative metal-binding motif-containing protein [Myxococcota bacterium]
MTARSLMAWLVLLAIPVALAGCGDDETPPETLLLRVTSDAPAGGGDLDDLRFLFVAEGPDGTVRFPAEAGASKFNRPVVEGFDPVAEPVHVAVEYGAQTFPDDVTVTLQVTGRSDGRAVAAFEGIVDLAAREVLPVHLTALAGDACDDDGDGFLDCSVEGCCPAGESAFSDCEPGEPGAHPWATEDPCDDCGDGIDQDCRDGDAVCVDDDEDGVPDCQEVDCGAGDPDVAPGLDEVCDGKDNDCDGDTDEGYTWTSGRALLSPGEECGLGVCAGGVVECTEDGSAAVCSTADLEEEEACGDGLDNDCDGSTDEGCEANDLDGDGWTVDDGDCNDFDSSVHPGAEEPCCQEPIGSEDRLEKCDRNCNGDVDEFCDANDADGDGFAPPNDCDDTDPLVYPEAPEKCGDGIDQDCFGGDVACDGVTDADGDGWSPPADCDDSDPAVNPEAAEICDAVDNDCDGDTDEGNPDTNDSEPCGSDVGECQKGTRVCVNTFGADAHGEKFEPGDVVCIDQAVGTDETCDGLDNDCDGDTDEDFPWEGLPVTYGEDGPDQECDGTGACGIGVVECLPDGSASTCSTNPDGSVPGDGPETCDGLDNDCDGTTDEDLVVTTIDDPLGDDPLFADGEAETTCTARGECGNSEGGQPLGVATCVEDPEFGPDEEPHGIWDCDYSAISTYEAGVEVSCDGLDNDCDGKADDDFTVESVGNVVGVGNQCDSDDEDECAEGTVICLPDESGAFCDEPEDANVSETCDDADNDCDGLTDEDFISVSDGGEGLIAYDGGPFPGDAGGFMGDACGTGVCSGGLILCDGEDNERLTCDSLDQVSTEICDNLDNDCDGDTDEDLTDIADAGCLTEGACGEAGQTTALCTAGDWECFYDSPNYQEGDELGRCDELDNDCDGLTDEDFSAGGSISYTELDGETTRTLGEACGLGECAGGTVQCGADGDTLVCPATEAATTDVCDGLDNDCDGTTDDAYVEDGTVTYDGGPYAADAGKVLGDSCGAGACAGGTVVCDGTEALTCDTLGEVSPELCNGIDDDCDGETDEDFKPGGEYTYDGGPFGPDDGKALGQSCGTGACDGGVVVCDPEDPALLTCDKVSDASSEICNDQDDDCDGRVDEDYKADGTVTYDGGPYSADADKVLGQSCGTGDCAGGLVECDADDPTQLTCSNLFKASDEVCDDADNDCDGTVDDPFYDGTVTYDGGPYAPDDGAVKEEACGTGQCSGGQVVCDESDATGMSLTCGTLTEADDEACNELDDDCDGETDEDYKDGTITYDGGPYSGDAGTSLDDSCGVGDCTGGTVVCSDAGGLTCSTADLAAAADFSCNDKDDDCNGTVDDAYTEEGQLGTSFPYTDWDGTEKYKQDSCGTGICAGEVVCATNSSLGCDGPASEPDDDCDGVDDDCDGETDEHYVPTDTTCGVGPCASTGELVCTTDGLDDTCTAGTPSTQTDDTCDGVDDDCDGTVDEDYVPTATDCGTGVCSNTGTLECVDGETTDTCTPGSTTGSDDDCDGVDENCNGSTDENYVAPDTSCGDGVCASTGTLECVNGETTDTCTEGDPLSSTDATCDGVDDDCDGETDEDYVPVTDCGTGVCQTNNTPSSCVGGIETDCQPGSPTGDDSACNGLDDNCDGSTDENYVQTRCDSEADADTCRTGLTTCSGGDETCQGDAACEAWEPGCTADSDPTVPDQCVCTDDGTDSCTENHPDDGMVCDATSGDCVSGG